MIDLPRGSSLPALSGREAEFTGLPLRDDLEKRQRLAAERKREYNEFLAKKEQEEELKKIERKYRERKHSRRKDACAAGTNEKAVQVAESTNGKAEQAPRRGLSEDDLLQVSLLKQETDRLRAEREEFAKLISSLREVVLTARRKSSSKSEQRLDQRDRRLEARGSTVIDQSWERSQSLDRGLKGRQKFDEGQKRRIDSEGELRSQLASSQPTHLERLPPCGGGLEDVALRRGPRTHVSVKEQYIRDLEAQIRETRERRLMEKEEEARLDKKRMMECYEPWARACAPGKEPGRKPRFIGELVHPVETSSSIIPTKARSESSLVPRFCPELALPGSLRRHFFPSDFGGRRAKPAKSTATVESYRDELRQQQIEDKKRRVEEQKQRDSLDEEKLIRRIEEQRQRMFQEYQEEQERKHKKDAEVRKKQERLVKLQRDKSRELQKRSKSRADVKEKRKSSRTQAKSSSSENRMPERQGDVDEVQTEVKTFHASSRQRRRSESRDRLVNNVEILRRQLATEQQISRIQQLQKNYVVTDLRRKADPDDWIFPP